MKNFILFGPPGVGKSTLIGHLKAKGFSAIDLEDMYPNRLRFQIPNVVKGTFIGGADLNPKRKYPSSVKVLIIADQDKYDTRRARRDAIVEGKSKQTHHDVSAWLTPETYDYVIDTTHHSVATTVAKLTSLFKEVNSHG